MDLSETMSEYAQKRRLGRHSLRNAIRLASGRISMVILMQEPCNRADTKPYQSMMNENNTSDSRKVSGMSGCPSLCKVNEAIQLASDGRYHIHDVAVFDLNTMLSAVSRQKQHISEHDIEEAQAICLKMIRLEKPKVILSLTCAARTSNLKGVRVFSSSLMEAGTVQRRSIGKGEASHSFGLVKGFHPSVFLRADYVAQRGWSEDEVSLADRMLHFCFRRAFQELDDQDEADEDLACVSQWRACCARRQ